MCVGSVILGKQTYAVETTGQILDGAVRSFKANPYRVGFIITARTSALLIMRDAAANGPWWRKLAVAEGSYQSDLFRIEQYGQIVTDSFHIQATGGAVDFTVIELLVEPFVMAQIQKESNR